MNLFLKLLLIGVSLHTYYFHSVGLALISVVSLLIMIGVVYGASMGSGLKIQKDASLGVVVAYLMILFWSMLGLIFYGDAPNTKRFLAFPAIIAGALVAGRFFRIIPLEDMLRFYLTVHVSAFLLQFSVYYATGYVIDYLAPITGDEQKIFGGGFTFPLMDRFMRAAGLFLEPGTYACFVAPFVALFERYYEKTKFNKFLYWISLLSLVLSLSTFGIVYAAMILMFSKVLRWSQRVGLVFIFTAFAAPYLIYRFVLRASLGLDTGVEIRQTYIEESFGFLLSNPVSFLFGSNLLVIDPRVELGASSNDAGVVLYFLHFSGVPLTLLLGAALIYASIKLDRLARVALLMVLLSKHTPFALFFPFIMAAIFATSGAAFSRRASTGQRPQSGHFQASYSFRAD